MKKRLFLVFILIAIIFFIAGCNKNVDEQVDNDDEIIEIDEEPKKANETEEEKLNMPENVRIRLEKTYPDLKQGAILETYKLGNDLVTTQVSTSADMTPLNNWAYHYYKYKGNNTWDDYYRSNKEDWRLYRENINLKQLKAVVDLGGINNPLPEETQDAKHEIINVTGLGDVDTVILEKENENSTTYIYYSNEYNLKIKVTQSSDDTTDIIKVYDKSITSFPISIP